MIIVSFSRYCRFISLLLIFPLLNFGCAPVSKIFSSRGKTYQYIYEMTEPAASKEMTFKAPEFTIGFQIDQGAINYNLRSMSSSRLSVLAGNASIGINGKYTPVRTSATYYVDSVSYLVSQSVLSSGYIRDFFIPRSNIFYTGNRWVERVLFTTKDEGIPSRRQAIQKNVGSEVALVFPFSVGTTASEYTFKFKITGVRVIDPDSVQPAGPRLPIPLMPKKPPTTMELWSSIGIVSSVILFSVFLVTRDKPFPGGL